jgi:hypothetical protein
VRGQEAKDVTVPVTVPGEDHRNYSSTELQNQTCQPNVTFSLFFGLYMTYMKKQTNFQPSGWVGEREGNVTQEASSETYLRLATPGLYLMV